MRRWLPAARSGDDGGNGGERPRRGARKARRSKGKEVWLLVVRREVGGGRSSGGSELGLAINGVGVHASSERGGWRASEPERERAEGIRDRKEHEALGRQQGGKAGVHGRGGASTLPCMDATKALSRVGVGRWCGNCGMLFWAGYRPIWPLGLK